MNFKKSPDITTTHEMIFVLTVDVVTTTCSGIILGMYVLRQWFKALHNDAQKDWSLVQCTVYLISYAKNVISFVMF